MSSCALCFLAFLIAVCTITSTFAQKVSPEPEVDPIPTTPSTAPGQYPLLFLTNAGRPPHSDTPLMPFTTLPICPKDYKTGFSIRCQPLSEQPGTVSFWVRGKLFEKEYHAPYYVSGNWKRFVGRFKELDGLEKGQGFRVTCRVRKEKKVWVYLEKSC